jgi:excisionase family DNA binding protein
MTTTQPELLTVRELGEYMRISRRTAYEWVYTGRVPHVRIGSTIRIPRAELERQLGLTSEMREPHLGGAQDSRGDYNDGNDTAAA